MNRSLSLFWRILVVQSLVGMIMLAGLRTTALMSDPALIPWKPTIGFLILSVTLVAAQVAARLSLVRAVFGARLELADAFWRSLSFALAVFYLVLAIANVMVLNMVAFDTWLVYKIVVPFIALLVFVAAFASRLPAPATRDDGVVLSKPFMAAYALRYFFDPGSGVFLWSASDNARERFGYPVSHHALGLSDEIILDGDDLLARFDASLDLDNPGEVIWSESERLRFARDARAFLMILRNSLGAEFSITDESAPAP